MSNQPPLKRFKSRLLSVLAAAAIVTLVLVSGLTWRADIWLYDALIRQAARTADDSIVVVAIDEKSLAELGRWPWSRRIHAQLIDRLTAAPARGVAMDVLLSEPALFDPEGDALLAQALGNSGKVVLPVFAEAREPDGTAVELMPIPEFAASAAALGHVNMALDADNVARSVFLRAGLGAPHWSALALALKQLDDPDGISASLPGLRNPGLNDASPQQWVRDHEVLVPYTNPPSAFQHVSYTDVLNGRVPASMLRDRWILIGVTVAGMGNEVATPGWRANTPRVSGVDYQANVLNMLVHGDGISPLTLTAQVLLSIALVTLPLLLLGLPGLRTFWRPLAVVLLGVPLVTYVLLRFGQVWFPPMSALLVLAIGVLLRIVKMLRRTQYQVQSDPLTGLANRLRFDEGLEHEMRSSKRTGLPMSLLLLDVDYFRGLNDGAGHQAGDEVLRALSQILRGRARRPRDLVARLGGDEFAVLLPETTPQAAAAIATTLHVDLANLSARHSSQSSLPPFTISVGIHTIQGSDELTAEEVFERADAALYQAKQAGRNRSFSHTGDNSFTSI